MIHFLLCFLFYHFKLNQYDKLKKTFISKKTKKKCKSLPANKENANLQNNYNPQAKMKQCKKGVKKDKRTCIYLKKSNKYLLINKHIFYLISSSNKV